MKQLVKCMDHLSTKGERGGVGVLGVVVHAGCLSRRCVPSLILRFHQRKNVLSCLPVNLHCYRKPQ